MRPPLKKRIDSNLLPAQADSKSEGLEEKAKLARHLHDQGVNPLRWTEAHPARQSDQQQFQETGRKACDNQFEVDGKLYDWTPSVTATPEQAKAIANAYIAERSGKDDAAALTPKIEDLVDIAEVPLKHPFGTPHNERPANDMSAAEERIALLRHYARSGVDPDKAHLGDPVYMKDQERLKAQIAKVLPGDRSEISGLPVFYQGFDDGWIYQANEATRAKGEEALAVESEAVAANENVSRNNAKDETRANSDTSTSVAASNTGNGALETYKAVIQNVPEIADLLEDLQAGNALTEKQREISERITASLKKAGIEFDYRASDPDQIRAVLAAEEKHLHSLDTSSPAAVQLALAGFTAELSEVLAGGRFDAVRMRQADSVLERLKLVAERFLPLRQMNTVKSAVTPISIEAAKEGPIDYDAVMDEMKGLLTDIGLMEESDSSAKLPGVAGLEGRQRQRELQPASTETVQQLSSGLTDARDVEIVIGGVPLFKQSEHKTLMDEIFRTEFIKIAQEKGCLPGPEGEQWDSRGGSKSQRRITDVDKRGHLGSRQPDGWVSWKNSDGTWTETLWNSTSTFADGFTEISREAIALKDTILKADKQFAMTTDMKRLLDYTEEPVLGKANMLSMGEKPNWNETELREFISKKLREFFDKNFKDCKFIGEDRFHKLDDPNDPDLPSTPPR